MATTKHAKAKTKTKTKAKTKAEAKAKATRARGADETHETHESHEAFAEVSAFDELGGLDASELGGLPLAYEDRQLLGRVARFLATIVAAPLLRRAVGAGYSRAEHDELWRLYLAASGRDRPLDFAFAAIDGARGGDVGEVLRALDAFENEWLPKARAIAQRRVPEAHVERFVAAFFKDLQQQPLGPLVIDSVATFVDRVEALATSPEPGADLVLRDLRQRGLTDAKLASVRALLGEAKGGKPRERPAVDADAMREAHALQKRALRELRLAWNDWATTLRQVFGVREQLQLALTEVKVRAEAEGPTPPIDAPPAPPSPA